MTELIRVAAVEPLEGWSLRLWFSDGAIKDVDLTALLARGGVFESIRDDRSVFEQVRVDERTRTIEWPGEVDLDPDVLYGLREPAGGAKIRRRTVSAPAAA